MRILVIADIHSNWHALDAIREPFDACLFVGDIVDYGTDPVRCITWAKNHVTAGIRGNHDHAVAQRITARGGRGFRRLAAATRPLQWDLIDQKRLKYLARLPVTQHVEVGGLSFFLVHATPRDPMDEYLTDDIDAWNDRLQTVKADFVCVGHTHIPCHLQLNDKQLLNPGSVGQPRDGDPRAAYAIIEDGKVHLRRVEYDIDATLEQMRSTGIDEWVVRLNEQVFRSGGNISRDEMESIR
ncbi:MAG: metallophosphoesterase family protein [Planctomycetaceae bacterium]|nr:metallophosphoesterase family protein [Planctomycetaceae bacterium]